MAHPVDALERCRQTPTCRVMVVMLVTLVKKCGRLQNLMMINR